MKLQCNMVATVAQSVKAYTLHPSCDIPKLLKHVVTAAMQTPRKQLSDTGPRR